MPRTTLKRFSAIVNGKRRHCTVELQPGYANDVEEAEFIMKNTETSYREFYKDATQADYDSDLEFPRLKVIR